MQAFLRILFEIVIVTLSFKSSTIRFLRFPLCCLASPLCSVFKVQIAPGASPDGGDKRVRTADPLLAKQVLSQLSYTPENGGP